MINVHTSQKMSSCKHKINTGAYLLISQSSYLLGWVLYIKQSYGAELSSRDVHCFCLNQQKWRCITYHYNCSTHSHNWSPRHKGLRIYRPWLYRVSRWHTTYRGVGGHCSKSDWSKRMWLATRPRRSVERVGRNRGKSRARVSRRICDLRELYYY